MAKSLDSFNCKRTLKVGDAEYTYFNLPEAEKNGLTGISRLPYSMKVLLENLLLLFLVHSICRRLSVSVPSGAKIP